MMNVKCNMSTDECLENGCDHASGHKHQDGCKNETCIEKGIPVACLPFAESVEPVYRRDLEQEVTELTERVDRLTQALLVADDAIAALEAKQRAVAAPRSFYEDCVIQAMRFFNWNGDFDYAAKMSFGIAGAMQKELESRRS